MGSPLNPGYYGSEELRGFGFKAVGRNVRVARDCVVIGQQNISLGDDIRIDSGTTIVATTGALTMEGLNHIGGQCHFCVAADLTIGEYSGTSQGVRIYTASDELSSAGGVRIRSINVARYVCIGAGSVVLPGCDIGEGSAVGALSLVNRKLRPWGIYHGNPVKRVNERPTEIEPMLSTVRTRLGRTDLRLVS
jgi:galactoside O-acetyltransferase